MFFLEIYVFLIKYICYFKFKNLKYFLFCKKYLIFANYSILALDSIFILFFGFTIYKLKIKYKMAYIVINI